MKPRVTLIPTGGTISSRSTEMGAALVAGSAEDLLRQMPDLRVQISLQEPVIRKGSAQIVPEDWTRIAEAAAGALDSGAEGVVILHGTDTMHYTAAALSFMLKDLSRPVVLTGSMIPGGDAGSDAAFNLQNAIMVAARGNLGEVCIVFSANARRSRGMILRGNRARKIHSLVIDAFASINLLPLGYIERGRIVYTKAQRRKRREGKVRLCPQLNPRVVLLKQNPALTPDMLRRFLEGAAGAVIEGTGAGHLRLDQLEVIASFPGPVLMSTQAIWGGVKWGLYVTDRAYAGVANLLPGGDMTSETALVKLMWALGQEGDIRKTMLTSIAGELTESPKIPPSIVASDR
jgi:glutamyl-tRNA(Gln) amidotransferase subunit D